MGLFYFTIKLFQRRILNMEKIEYVNGVDEIYHDIKDFPDIVIHFDGGVRPKNPGKHCCFAYVIFDPKKLFLAKGYRWLTLENATNNYSEYCGVISGLKFLLDHDWAGNSISLRGDSKLIINQLNQTYKTKDKRLKELVQKCWDILEDDFSLTLENVDETALIVPQETKSNSWNSIWTRRENNSFADKLTHLAWEHCKNANDL